jgi:hypothetical protein
MSISLAEIFRQAIANGSVRTHVQGWKVANDVLNCRTESLGGHLYKCSDCQVKIPVYNSCRNRHCPKCQGQASAKWLEARKDELLSAPYFHLVFTVPHELNGLFLQNKELLFNILFRASAKTLKDVAKRRLGGSLGFFSVLHSWGKKMEFHPHVHTVVPGVILKQDGEIKLSADNYLLPKNVLSPVFRAIFIKSLVRAFRQGKLILPGELEKFRQPSVFFSLIKTIKTKHWICYAKKPFAGPDAVLKYLALYTHRVAISEKRLVALKNGLVTFTYKDYADKCKTKPLTLSVAEFTRRFLLHVLPKRFVRIRYSGFLSSANRATLLLKLKESFRISDSVELKPFKPRTCPLCNCEHLDLIEKLPRAMHSSSSHKTKILPLVA